MSYLLKIATRAWKVHTLSNDNLKRLEDSGVLNHDKELVGLEQGNENLRQKYRVPVINMVDYTEKPAAKGMKGYIQRRAYDAHLSDYRTADTGIYLGKPDSLLRQAGMKPMQFNNKERERIHQEMFRHELDEYRASSKMRTFSEMNRTRMSSHSSPEVVMREGNRMMTAPLSVRSFFSNARQHPQLGMYLSGGKFRPEQRTIQGHLQDYQYGKTYADKKTINSVVENYRTDRGRAFSKINLFESGGGKWRQTLGKILRRSI